MNVSSYVVDYLRIMMQLIHTVFTYFKSLNLVNANASKMFFYSIDLEVCSESIFDAERR